MDTRVPLKEDWRSFLIDALNRIFRHVKEGSLLYGLGHALSVEETVLKIITSEEHVPTHYEIPVLLSAALLHDIGFAVREKRWSSDFFEHVDIGKKLASEILSQAPVFCDDLGLISQALFLIEHHDDTTYSFPTATTCGSPHVYSNGLGVQGELGFYLAILKEADAQVHALENCVQEAVTEWENYGLPFYVGERTLIPTWRWNDSIFGNIRLLGKRAILDAYTLTGKQIALGFYDRLEDYLKIKCEEFGILYEPEVCHPATRQVSIGRISSKQCNLEIIRYAGWNELVRKLHNVTLQDDTSIHPYQEASIEVRLVDFDEITPMALYVMQRRLEENLELHDALMAKFGLGLWDLPGVLEFRYNSREEQTIAPPLIEIYKEVDINAQPQLMGLVDGLHRCIVIRRLGQRKIRAIVTSNVPYPLVPLPVNWDEIQIYDREPPMEERKRRYRYTSWTDVPIEIRNRFRAITEENFRYFFYRDLSPLGSKGRRDFHEFDAKRY